MGQAAFCGTRISPRLSEDNVGNLICHRVVIARSGLQGYSGREIGLDTDNRVVVVRPPSEVLSPATLASATGKVLTDGHPEQMLTPSNTYAFSKGFVLHVEQGPTLASGDVTIVADLVVTDSVLKQQILDNVKREVSAGYRCIWDGPNDDGRYVCREIRINHIAVVPRSRCGAACCIRDEREIMAETLQEKLERVCSGIERYLAREPHLKVEDADKLSNATKALRAYARSTPTNDAESVGPFLTELRRQEAEDFGKTAALYFRRRPCEARRIAAERSIALAVAASDNEPQPMSLQEFMEKDARDFQRECDEARARANAPRQ
jgi:hypothetical protein